MAQTTLRDYLQETEDAIKAGHLDEAQAHCQRILNQFPESLEAHRLLGEVYLAQNHLEEARQSFDWVLMNDPENVLAYCNRALVCERASDFDTALDCYQQAYELSRGNSQIRQKFNALSAKVGQPGFMFSRAGLARLYVRGDLLPQAKQEWDAVLAVSADRLDARLGLLETYWRQDNAEQVEQLARQIVQEVPGCLKALLLLAYVTASKNAQVAQELLQRVEALDPEMQMAQELFADTIARQPSHPFLQLWRKAPVVLDLDSVPPQQITQREAPAIPAEAAPVPASPADQLSWRNQGDWAGLDALLQLQQEQKAIQDTPTLVPWNHAQMDDPWSILEAQSSHSVAAASALPSSLEQTVSTPAESSQMANSSSATGWSAAREETPQMIEPPVAELPWSQQDRMADTAFIGNKWEDEQEQQRDDAQAVLSWPEAAQEESSAPPSWLSMLTQSEQPQMTTSQPSFTAENVTSTSFSTQPAELPPTQPPVLPERPVAQEPMAWREEVQPVQEVQPVAPADSDEDAPFFGPDWLRSLGAATLENSSSEEENAQDALLPSASSFPPRSPRVQPESVWSSWSRLQQEASEQGEMSAQAEPEVQTWEQPRHPATSSTWSPAQSWTEQAVAKNEQPDEQNLLTTLETLEQGLYAQGFVPLEPNSLSSIAHSQAALSHTSAEQTLPEEAAEEEAMLSSAFAQFGPLAPQSLPPIPATPVLPAQTIPGPAEPSWVAALHSVPMTTPTEKPASTRIVPKQPEMPAASVPPTPSVYQPAAPMPPVQKPQSNPTVQPVRKDVLPGPVYQPTPVVPQTPVESAQVPVARTEALLDSELEVTMKRPAIRVQAMQQRAGMLDAATLSGRGRANDVAMGGKSEGGSESYRERLLRGYQHQLVGDYDEAMQEYRLVIRNAPELLSDVVSNVRALLKLAPKYSAGYRVLGDAYMRQGEYLQAMEAYNKALTMAKKAKG
jgi:tetratricopeptide (TPR) repeat protein